MIANLNWLCSKILDPLREKLGKPISVSSGYRCDALNIKAGGTTNPPSQHTTGKAADIIITGMTPKQVMDFVINNTNLPFDQIILEYNSWCHLSYDHDKLQQRGTKYVINTGTGYLPYKG